MNPQKLAKWIAWMGRIQDEIYYLLDNRKVFRLLVKQHNNFGKMRDPRVWSFVTSNYAGNMTVCICRQVDMDDQVVSLLALLEDLLTNYEMITREWFLSQYPDACEPVYHSFIKHLKRLLPPVF